MLWPAGGFAVGLAAGGDVRAWPVWGTAALVWLAARSTPREMVVVALFAIAGFANGLGRGAAPDASSRERARPVLVTGRVSASEWTREGSRFLLDRDGGVRVLVNIASPDPPAPGAIVAVFGELRPMGVPRNPGEWGRGDAQYALRAESEAAVFVISGARAPSAWLFAARVVIRERMLRAIDGRPGGLLRALLLGDRSGLDTVVLDRFRLLGLFHILSISGMHIAVVASILLALSRVLLPRSRWWGLPAVIGVLVYVPLAGASGPVLRSGVMGLIALAFLMSGRRFDPLNVLALAFLATAVVAPGEAFAPGYVLSYLATAGLLVYMRFARRLRWRGRLANLVHGLGVSVAASLATFPVVTAMFGRNPLGGVPYSLPGGFLVGLVIVPALAGMILLPVAPLSELAFLAAWPALHLLGLMATAPLPAPGFSPTFATAMAISIGIAALTVPGNTARAWLARASLASLTLLLPRGSRPDVPELVMLDVGAGDALVLRLPDGHDLVIDTGKPERSGTVGRALAALEVDRATLVVTHPDDDHDGGVGALVAEGRVREIVAAITERDGAGLDYASSGKSPVRFVSAGDTLWRHARGEIVCLHPSAEDIDLLDNERSIVLRLRWDAESILLTGDLEGEGIRRLIERTPSRPGEADPLDATVLKVGHHGSPAASPEDFLARVTAGIALVSCGRAPPAETLARLRESGAWICRTDERGALRLRLDGRGMVSGWGGNWSTISRLQAEMVRADADRAVALAR